MRVKTHMTSWADLDVITLLHTLSLHLPTVSSNIPSSNLFYTYSLSFTFLSFTHTLNPQKVLDDVLSTLTFPVGTGS